MGCNKSNFHVEQDTNIGNQDSKIDNNKPKIKDNEHQQVKENYFKSVNINTLCKSFFSNLSL